MSTNQRFVPVKLIAGKEYVLRNGRHVTVQENPHWQCRVNYPFAVIQGPDFVVYYGEEGNTGSGTAHEHDIMRPVYKAGEVYLTREGMRQVIGLDGNDPTYPLENEERGASWARDGRGLHFTISTRQGDLMDYAPPLPVFPAMPELAPTEALPSLVGRRVELTIHTSLCRGVVKFEDDDGFFAVELDADVQDRWLHDCGGRCKDGRGWWAPRDSLRTVGETPVEAESSESLTEADVAEVWAAYRINPSISIDAWIAARRQLKATAK